MKNGDHRRGLGVALCVLLTSLPAQGFELTPGTVEADRLSGANSGQQINAAVARLGSAPGTITMAGAGEILEPIRLGVGQSLIFGPGTWICRAAPCIVLSDAAEVRGAGVFRTRLLLDPGSAGPVIQGKDYPRLTNLSEAEAMASVVALDGDRKALPGVKYVAIRDLTLDGQKSLRQGPANGVEIYGYWFTLDDLAIERFSGDGLVTAFIPAADVHPEANDAMESYISRVKLLSNAGNGWTMMGPHDSIASGVIIANNGGWGLDVRHRDGHYSGAGLMLSDTHLYGNGDGLRTEQGANILASGLESEANRGVGLLLRSNDSVVQGLFYANGTYGIQLGEGEFYAGANLLTVQVHNNHLAQVHWANSGGHNLFQGVVFPQDATQKFFAAGPATTDLVQTAGPYAVQQFPGGIKMDSDRNLYGVKPIAPPSGE